jgi:hypothetical protein
MDLKLICDSAIYNVKLAHIDIELEQYTKVLGYATYEMKSFDILLNKVQALNEEKSLLMGKIKQLR